MRNPLIPAFRLRNAAGCVIGFRCPFCGDVHTHGCGNRRTVQWRGRHCIDPASRGKNYRLLVIGSVASPRMLPEIALSDVVALNRALAPCDAHL